MGSIPIQVSVVDSTSLTIELRGLRPAARLCAARLGEQGRAGTAVSAARGREGRRVFRASVELEKITFVLF